MQEYDIPLSLPSKGDSGGCSLRRGIKGDVIAKWDFCMFSVGVVTNRVFCSLLVLLSGISIYHLEIKILRQVQDDSLMMFCHSFGMNIFCKGDPAERDSPLQN